jgi:hypothetical protein
LLLAANVGDALVGEPVVVVGQSLVDAVVEVLVVGEDDVATNVVELEWRQYEARGSWTLGTLTKPSGVVSVEARPPGVSLESTISHEGPS